MKRINLTIAATIFATFVVSLFAFQPTTEAGSNPTPTATPSSRTKRPKQIQSPKPIQSPITTKSKVKPKGIDAASPYLKTNKPKRRIPAKIGTVKPPKSRTKTSGKFFDDMMEGSNIKRKQPRRPKKN